MLKTLLALIRDGDARTPQELAAVLAIPLSLVEQMLGQLVDGGYLIASEACNDGCSGCALAQACGALPGGLRLWTLTAKGAGACS